MIRFCTCQVISAYYHLEVSPQCATTRLENASAVARAGIARSKCWFEVYFVYGRKWWQLGSVGYLWERKRKYLLVWSLEVRCSFWTTLLGARSCWWHGPCRWWKVFTSNDFAFLRGTVPEIQLAPTRMDGSRRVLTKIVDQPRNLTPTIKNVTNLVKVRHRARVLWWDFSDIRVWWNRKGSITFPFWPPI